MVGRGGEGALEGVVVGEGGEGRVVEGGECGVMVEQELRSDELQEETEEA